MDLPSTLEADMKKTDSRSYSSNTNIVSSLQFDKSVKSRNYRSQFTLNDDILVAVDRREEYKPIENKVTIEVDICLGLCDPEESDNTNYVVRLNDMASQNAWVYRMITYDSFVDKDISSSIRDDAMEPNKLYLLQNKHTATTKDVLSFNESLNENNYARKNLRTTQSQFTVPSDGPLSTNEVTLRRNDDNKIDFVSYGTHDILRNELLVQTAAPMYEFITDKTYTSYIDIDLSTKVTELKAKIDDSVPIVNKIVIPIYKIDENEKEYNRQHFDSIKVSFDPPIVDKVTDSASKKIKCPDKVDSIPFAEETDDDESSKFKTTKELSKSLQYYLPIGKPNEDCDDIHSEVSTCVESSTETESVNGYFDEVLLSDIHSNRNIACLDEFSNVSPDNQSVSINEGYDEDDGVKPIVKIFGPEFIKTDEIFLEKMDEELNIVSTDNRSIPYLIYDEEFNLNDIIFQENMVLQVEDTCSSSILPKHIKIIKKETDYEELNCKDLIFQEDMVLHIESTSSPSTMDENVMEFKKESAYPQKGKIIDNKPKGLPPRVPSDESQDDFVPVSVRRQQFEELSRANPYPAVFTGSQPIKIRLITSNNYTDILERERLMKEETKAAENKDIEIDKESSISMSSGSMVVKDVLSDENFEFFIKHNNLDNESNEDVDQYPLDEVEEKSEEDELIATPENTEDESGCIYSESDKDATSASSFTTSTNRFNVTLQNFTKTPIDCTSGNFEKFLEERERLKSEVNKSSLPVSLDRISSTSISVDSSDSAKDKENQFSMEVTYENENLDARMKCDMNTPLTNISRSSSLASDVFSTSSDVANTDQLAESVTFSKNGKCAVKKGRVTSESYSTENSDDESIDESAEKVQVPKQSNSYQHTVIPKFRLPCQPVMTENVSKKEITETPIESSIQKFERFLEERQKKADESSGTEDTSSSSSDFYKKPTDKIILRQGDSIEDIEKLLKQQQPQKSSPYNKESISNIEFTERPNELEEFETEAQHNVDKDKINRPLSPSSCTTESSSGEEPSFGKKEGLQIDRNEVHSSASSDTLSTSSGGEYGRSQKTSTDPPEDYVNIKEVNKTSSPRISNISRESNKRRSSSSSDTSSSSSDEESNAGKYKSIDRHEVFANNDTIAGKPMTPNRQVSRQASRQVSRHVSRQVSRHVSRQLSTSSCTSSSSADEESDHVKTKSTDNRKVVENPKTMNSIQMKKQVPSKNKEVSTQLSSDSDSSYSSSDEESSHVENRFIDHREKLKDFKKDGTLEHGRKTNSVTEGGVQAEPKLSRHSSSSSCTLSSSSENDDTEDAQRKPHVDAKPISKPSSISNADTSFVDRRERFDDPKSINTIQGIRQNSNSKPPISRDSSSTNSCTLSSSSDEESNYNSNLNCSAIHEPQINCANEPEVEYSDIESDNLSSSAFEVKESELAKNSTLNYSNDINAKEIVTKSPTDRNLISSLSSTLVDLRSIDHREKFDDPNRISTMERQKKTIGNGKHVTEYSSSDSDSLSISSDEELEHGNQSTIDRREKFDDYKRGDVLEYKRPSSTGEVLSLTHSSKSDIPVGSSIDHREKFEEPKGMSTLERQKKMGNATSPILQNSPTDSDTLSDSSDEESAHQTTNIDRYEIEKTSPNVSTTDPPQIVNNIKEFVQKHRSVSSQSPSRSSKPSDCAKSKSIDRQEKFENANKKSTIEKKRISNVQKTSQARHSKSGSDSLLSSSDEERDVETLQRSIDHRETYADPRTGSTIERHSKLCNGKQSISKQSSSSSYDKSLPFNQEKKRTSNPDIITSKVDKVEGKCPDFSTSSQLSNSLTSENSFSFDKDEKQQEDDSNRRYQTLPIKKLPLNIPIKERSKSLEKPVEPETNYFMSMSNRSSTIDMVEKKYHEYTETWSRISPINNQSTTKKQLPKPPKNVENSKSRTRGPLTTKPRPVPSYMSPVNSYPYSESDGEFGSNESIVNDYNNDAKVDEISTRNSSVQDFIKELSNNKLYKSPQTSKPTTPKPKMTPKSKITPKIVDLNYGYQEDMVDYSQTSTVCNRRVSGSSVTTDGSYLDKPTLSVRPNKTNLAKLDSLTSSSMSSITIPVKTNTNNRDFRGNVSISSLSTSTESINSNPEPITPKSTAINNHQISNNQMYRERSKIINDSNIYPVRSNDNIRKKIPSTSESSEYSSTSDEESSSKEFLETALD